MPRGKKGSQPNRSQLIREALQENPQASAKDIVDLLAHRQIKVTTSLVYMIKGRLKQVKVHRKRKARRVAAVVSNSKVSDPVALIRRVKELAHEAGGMANLKELLAVLSE